MPSRDPNDLYEPLRARWEWMRSQWSERYPEAPQPFLTCTHRPASEQQALVDAGKSRAKPMQSLHNFLPSYAMDVAFRLPDGSVTWEFRWFERWGELAEEIGLEWGGRWPQLVDGPHVQWPTTWRVAQAGKLPPLPPLPDREQDGELIPAETLHVRRADGSFDVIALDPDRPARLVGSKLYANEPL